MSATLMTVTIGGTEYEAYADVAFVDDYLNAIPNADAWRAITDDETGLNEKGRAIILAGRVLDRQPWPGIRTDPYQPLAFPRTNLIGPDGSTIDPDTIPLAIMQACAELANESVNGTDIANYTSTISLERRVKAGSVEVENFRAIDLGSPLPLSAWALIRPYLISGGGLGVGGAISSGTCAPSQTCVPYGHNASL